MKNQPTGQPVIRNFLSEHIQAVFNSYSEIFFLKGRWTGLFILLLTMVNPSVGLGGIISVLSAYLFSHLIKMSREYLKSGFFTYNPLLVGLSIGSLFKITPLTVILLVAAGIMTFVLTQMMHSIFWYYLKLPILSLPFVLVSSASYLAASSFSNLYVSGLYPDSYLGLELVLPVWLSGFFKCLGAIVFMPDVTAGILLALIILAASRILLMLMVTGYYSGSLMIALMTGSFQQAFTSIGHFNFIWIAIAIGGIFLIPSLRSYLIAVIAVLTSTIFLKAVEVFWADFGIPVFALPFNVVSLSFIYFLGMVKFPYMSQFVKNTPEESLDYFIATHRRFKGSDRTLALPFIGKWMVWQGFNGRWTHQGSWQHAYDFVIADDQGNTYRGEGSSLEDYYAFRKPVMSPVKGRVVKVTDGEPDNPPGQTDKVNNWGNAVVIYDSRGYYVEISHFQEESIRVSQGDWVERGTILGQCGNSGFSPQPHIHVQVQATEDLGALTLPFSFISYLSDGQYHANNLPKEKASCEPVPTDSRMDQILSFVLDQKYRYDVFYEGQPAGRKELEVKIGPDGTMFFDSGDGQLYFGKFEGTFYIYNEEGNDPFLRHLFLAMPRIPLVRYPNLKWSEYIPGGSQSGAWIRNIKLFLGSFNHDLLQGQAEYEFQSGYSIFGTVKARFRQRHGPLTTKLTLNPSGGITQIQVGEWEYVLNDEET